MRIYTPPGSGLRPAISVYYHLAAGTACIGSLDSHDLVARNLCGGAEAVVVSVDYRMGPEHRFPAAVEDSFFALDWVHANADSIGADPDPARRARGDSAGANLAAVVALMARDRGAKTPALRLQSLVYPVADFRMASDSYKKYATGCGILTAEAMKWFRGHYLSRMDEALDWRASPVLAPNFAGVAPAIIIAAECDVLHDEGVDLGDKLKAAGVPVERHEYAGMIHAFFGMMPAIDDAMNAQRAVWAAFGGRCRRCR